MRILEPRLIGSGGAAASARSSTPSGGLMGLFTSHKSDMVSADKALPGRPEPMEIVAPHLVLGTKLTPPFPDGFERAIFGMGCFWGAEKKFWVLPGVYTTAVGYAGG